MDLLFTYNQSKKDRRTKNISKCELNLYQNSHMIMYTSVFDSDYSRSGEIKNITFCHELKINLINGDIDVSNKVVNKNYASKNLFKNIDKKRKNNFMMLEDLISDGLIYGEKKIGFWGIKYDEAVEKIQVIIKNVLLDKMTHNYYVEKYLNLKNDFDFLYRLIVDFHLNMKKIKGHDNVYTHIRYDYPSKKWVVKNDGKFLPAILDNYGIKSKYLIGELSSYNTKTCIIKTVNYFCKLFGENYVEHLKETKWVDHCFDFPPNKHIHVLKNDYEKKNVISLINNWSKELPSETLIYSLNKLLSLREQLENIGYTDLKFNCKDFHSYHNLLQTWLSYLQHHKKGYKIRYNINSIFIQEIEENIVINGITFKPKVLLTEDDYRIEGYRMKNCMAQQFIHGAIYIYISLQCERKFINLQYRKNKLVQSYGKANTDVPEIFNDAIPILTKRFENWVNLTWKKEKYDFIKK